MARKKSEEEKTYDLLLANVRELSKYRFGKEFIWHVLSICNLYTDGFTGDDQTFYNEGKRAVGLQLLQLLDEADPTMYARLILEKQNIEVNNGPITNTDDTDDTD